MDAAHFVMGAFLGMIWCFEIVFIKSASQFSSAISSCLDSAHLKHKKGLDSLLTLRFQTFKKTQIMDV